MIPPVSSKELWCFKDRSIELSSRPCLMGILNLTPDSFSDGSSYRSVQDAVAAAEKMVADGADIIDIGGESTRPDAKPVDATEELSRVIPVIERLAGRVTVPISIDTWKAEVAEAALKAGAQIINDISAMTFDPQMAETVAASGAGIVLMHTRGRPAEMQRDTGYTDIVAEISAFLKERIAVALAAGIRVEQIVVDPGIGFGKSVSGNLEIIRRLSEFSCLNRPVLIGTSRKSFIGAALGRDVNARLFGTSASVAVGMMNGASIFRVHDVSAMRDCVDMVRAIMKS